MVKTLCLIPARQGSVGLKNKNIKLLNGIPLIKHAYTIAKRVKHIDDIVISSDSKKYLNKIENKNVIKILRPKRLSSSKSLILDVVKHTLLNIKKKYKYLILLEPTSPLTDPKEVNLAFKKLVNSNSKIDFVVSVISLPKYNSKFILKLDKKNKIKFKKFPKNSNRQSFKEEFFISGNFYIAKIDKLLQNKSWISNKTFGFKIKRSIHTDIDTNLDLLFTQSIIKNGLFKKIK